MSWSERNLTRLAYSDECRELSDLARGNVATVADGFSRAGEFVEEAMRLVAGASSALRLAVAFERARGSSWQEIGERLGTTRQAAHERYASIVEEINEAIAFPWRDDGEGPGWWACPRGLEDPDRTAASLDAWVARHRERTDPDRGEHAVSAGLVRRDDREVLDAIARTTQLADRLMNHALPEGVSERSAQRMLLDAKVRSYDLIAAKQTGEQASEARDLALRAFEQLVEWHRADVRERLGHVAYSDSEAFITLDGRPVRWLARSDDRIDEQARGWFAWGIGDQSTTEPLAGPQLPPALLHAALRAAGADSDGELVAPVDAPMTAALGPALDSVCEDIATDSAKGLTPFRPGGIAGPPPR